MQPKSFITRFLEIALAFAAGAYLVRLGVDYIIQVWPVIAIVVTLIVIGSVAYRIWKNKNDTKW